MARYFRFPVTLVVAKPFIILYTLRLTSVLGFPLFRQVMTGVESKGGMQSV